MEEKIESNLIQLGIDIIKDVKKEIESGVNIPAEQAKEIIDGTIEEQIEFIEAIELVSIDKEYVYGEIYRFFDSNLANF
jgi:hypothetical protein